MVLLVTDSFLKLQKVDKNGYFIPEISVLDSAQIHDFEIVWTPDLPMAQSMIPLKEKIEDSPEKVTIIAHGKGGIDALECLIQFPKLRDKVEKLVTIQS